MEMLLGSSEFFCPGESDDVFDFILKSAETTCSWNSRIIQYVVIVREKQDFGYSERLGTQYGRTHYQHCSVNALTNFSELE